MKANCPLVSIKEDDNPYLFNIYLYQGYLIGIEEDPKYSQLFEMTDYGTRSDYFTWRTTEIGFGSLLDIHGNALLKKNTNYRRYLTYLREAEETFHIDSRKWRNRIRK